MFEGVDVRLVFIYEFYIDTMEDEDDAVNTVSLTSVRNDEGRYILPSILQIKS